MSFHNQTKKRRKKTNLPFSREKGTSVVNNDCNIPVDREAVEDYLKFAILELIGAERTLNQPVRMIKVRQSLSRHQLRPQLEDEQDSAVDEIDYGLRKFGVNL